MPNEYEIGDCVRVHGNFLNSSSVSADPSSIFFRLVVGSSDIQYTYPTTTAIVKSDVGSYFVDVDINSPGEHWYYWRGYGDVCAAEYCMFMVHTPPFPF
jgi:hypothetical protein